MQTRLGMDVSHWQVNIDWPKAKDHGIEFAFIDVPIAKATQGADTLDSKFTVNWEGSRAVGLPRGAYHFYDYRVHPIKQAAWLLDNTNHDPGELGYVLDIEALKITPTPKPPATYAEDLRQFCEFISTQTATVPIIYTAYAFWTAYCGYTAHWARQYPLWIANYNNVAPMLPLPWGPDAWSFWQFTNKGPGLFYGVQSKQVDLNIWRQA
jgi:lysozyme